MKQRPDLRVKPRVSHLLIYQGCTAAVLVTLLGILVRADRSGVHQSGGVDLSPPALTGRWAQSNEESRCCTQGVRALAFGFEASTNNT